MKKKTLTSEQRKNGQQEARWTYLTNHAHVLIVLDTNPDSVLRDVAIEVGITERAVQRIILDLEQAGCITRERVGRQNRYEVHHNSTLRHPIESHCTIGEMLNFVRNSSQGSQKGTPND